jgi:hypothetical protein
MKRVVGAFLVFLLLTAGLAYAANRILILKGVPITFTDTGGDRALTLAGLAAATGCTTACTRCSAQYVKTGANVKSQLWEMRPHLQLTGTNSLNEVVEFYVATSDGTFVQGNIATTNGLIDINKRKNLTFAGVLVVDQQATNTTMVAAFPRIVIDEVAFQVCVSNQTSLPFNSSAVHGVTMTPMDLEVQ